MGNGRSCIATIFAAAGIAVALQVAAFAQAPAPAPVQTPSAGQPVAPPARTPPPGYLSGDIDLLRVIPPAPQKGDARDEADRRIFRETRALQGSARWAMAADDAELGSAALLRHFSCSLGIELTPLQAPRMVAMMQKATRDGAQAMLKAKDLYKRQRPYWVDEGPICRPRDELGNSFDYPSGHATAGWTWAMSLAQVAPERAIPILLRGRAIGDSRVICGVQCLGGGSRAPAHQCHDGAGHGHTCVPGRHAGSTRGTGRPAQPAACPAATPALRGRGAADRHALIRTGAL